MGRSRYDLLRFPAALVIAMAVALSGAIPREATAQAPMAADSQSVSDPAAPTEFNPLPGLPRPPDQPASLFQPAPAQGLYGCPDWERPYFQEDPLLDGEGPSQPGWLFDVEAGVLNAHVKESLGKFSPDFGPVPFPFVTVPMASLNWTVSPRFEFGYRLPSGFGEFDAAYRFLDAEGTGLLPVGAEASPDGPAALVSHLRFHVEDLDYANHETSLASALGLNWDMKWRIGLRIADARFDSRAEESPADAAAGTKIFERGIRDFFWGIGPHAGLELAGRGSPCGLGWVGRLDGGILFGTANQQFTAVPAPGGAGFVSNINDREPVDILSGFLGLDWRPPRYRNLDVLVGYSAEYWWGLGRISDPDFYSGKSAGEFGLHGAMFRVEYNY